MQDHSFVQAHVILHTIAGYDQATIEQAAMQILKGLSLCLREPTDLRKQITKTPDLWAILNRFRQIPEVAGRAFDVVAMIVGAKPAAVTADNYGSIVSLLHEFAMAGSIGAAIEQKRDTIARRRDKPVEKPKKVIKPR